MLFVFTLFIILYGYLKRAKQQNFNNLEPLNTCMLSLKDSSEPSKSKKVSCSDILTNVSIFQKALLFHADYFRQYLLQARC